MKTFARIALGLLVLIAAAVPARALEDPEPAAPGMALKERVNLADVIVLGKVRAKKAVTPTAARMVAGAMVTLAVEEVLTGGVKTKEMNVLVPSPLDAGLEIGRSRLWMLVPYAGYGDLMVPMASFLLAPHEAGTVREAMAMEPLHLSLAVDKREYTAPAAITVTVTLTNRGREPMVLINPYGPVNEDPNAIVVPSKDKTEGVQVEFSRYQTVQGKTLLVPFGIVLTQFPAAAEKSAPLVTLNYNESFTASVNLAERFNYPVTRTGRIALRFVYDSLRPHEGAPEHWSGKAVSTRVWTTVREAEK